MAETRRKFDADFREGAVRLVWETGKPIAQVARDLCTLMSHAGWLVAPPADPRSGTRSPGLVCCDVPPVRSGSRICPGYSCR